MNRRDFGRAVAGTMVAAGTTLARPQIARERTASAPFDVSVMLWTVFRNLPFETRLEKVAAAGYLNVELVGEYEHWSDADFDRVNAKRKQLAIQMNDILVQQVVVIPLVARKFPVAGKNKQLQGVQPSPWDGDLWNVADWSKSGS